MSLCLYVYFKTVPPASQLAIFYDRKGCFNVNMSDDLPIKIILNSYYSYLNSHNCKGELFALIYRNCWPVPTSIEAFAVFCERNIRPLSHRLDSPEAPSWYQINYVGRYSWRQLLHSSFFALFRLRMCVAYGRCGKTHGNVLGRGVADVGVGGVLTPAFL